ncbi:hypothetical protein D3C76_1796700 [compost metagenome]
MALQCSPRKTISSGKQVCHQRELLLLKDGNDLILDLIDSKHLHKGHSGVLMAATLNTGQNIRRLSDGGEIKS